MNPHCNTLQHAATRCNTLQHAAKLYQWRKNVRNPLVSSNSHTAIRCNTLQHSSATLGNSLHHTLPQKQLVSSNSTDIYMALLAQTCPPFPCHLGSTATHYNTLHYTVIHCNKLLARTRFPLPYSLGSTATHCKTLQRTATHRHTLNTLPHILGADPSSICLHSRQRCNTLQHTATHCNTLQHTATHILSWNRSPFSCHLVGYSQKSAL